LQVAVARTNARKPWKKRGPCRVRPTTLKRAVRSRSILHIKLAGCRSAYIQTLQTCGLALHVCQTSRQTSWSASKACHAGQCRSPGWSVTPVSNHCLAEDVACAHHDAARERRLDYRLACQ